MVGGSIENFIKGIYEQLKVSKDGQVEAGDFVRLLSDYTETNEGNDIELIAESDSVSLMLTAQLSQTKVFIAYLVGRNTYGIVCDINNKDITVGIPTLIVSNLNIKDISIVALNSKTVFMSYVVQGVQNYNIYGVLCNITGTEVTTAGNRVISDTSYSILSNTDTVKITENKVCVFYTGGNFSGFAVVCTISGNTISIGTVYKTGTTTDSIYYEDSSILLLNENTICMLSHTGKSLIVFIHTISGTTIKKVSSTKIASDYTGGNGHIQAIKLSENKILVLYGATDSNHLNGIVCSISNNTVTSYDTVEIDGTVDKTGWAFSGVLLSENTLLITYSYYQTTYNLYSILCSIEDTSIVPRTKIQLSSENNAGYKISTIALDEITVFILHTKITYRNLYAMIQDYFLNLVKTITSSAEKVGGVAITSGQPGDMVTIAKPDVI